METVVATPHSDSEYHDDDDEPMVALAKLSYRPSPWWKPPFFRTADVAETLVRMGRAHVASDLYAHDSATTTDTNNNTTTHTAGGWKDTTDAVRAVRSDATYVEQLTAAEYQAAAASRGLWAHASVRDAHADVAQEAEFQATAPWWRKLWRQWRGR